MNKNEFVGYCEIKYLRISPYKVRKVAKLINKYNVKDALKKLKVLPHNGASFLYKALHSAFHNAKEKGIASEDSLVIDKIMIDESKKLKRFNPRARGRAFSIIKRSCNIKMGIKETIGVTNGPKD